ncbi:hypothetical protein J4052_23500 [Bacillus toyonensis]|nr:hypothetical protein [Bacillus toyonensis]
MNMAILFRQHKDESPFAKALEELIETKGHQLILASGFIALNTKLIEWIIDACVKGCIKDIVIIGAYINPYDGGVIEQHLKLQGLYRQLEKKLDALLKGGLLKEELSDITDKMEEIETNHLIKKGMPNWLFSNSIRTIEKLRVQNKPYIYQNKNNDEIREKLNGFWKYTERRLNEIKKEVDMEKLCAHCKFEIFIMSLYVNLFKSEQNNINVNVIHIPDKLKKRWHSKIAMKIDKADTPIAALLGSSNLTTTTLPKAFGGTFWPGFSIESDIYIHREGSNLINAVKGENDGKDQDFSIIPVKPEYHKIDSILEAIYNGLKPYLY